jgi:hypothetical protein
LLILQHEPLGLNPAPATTRSNSNRFAHATSQSQLHSLIKDVVTLTNTVHQVSPLRPGIKGNPQAPRDQSRRTPIATATMTRRQLMRFQSRCRLAGTDPEAGTRNVWIGVPVGASADCHSKSIRFAIALGERL